MLCCAFQPTQGGSGLLAVESSGYGEGGCARHTSTVRRRSNTQQHTARLVLVKGHSLCSKTVRQCVLSSYAAAEGGLGEGSSVTNCGGRWYASIMTQRQALVPGTCEVPSKHRCRYSSGFASSSQHTHSLVRILQDSCAAPTTDGRTFAYMLCCVVCAVLGVWCVCNSCNLSVSHTGSRGWCWRR